jgi:plastocyanin
MKSKMMVWGGAAIVGLSLILSACGGGTATTDPIKTDPVKTDPVKTDPVATVTSTAVTISGFVYGPKVSTVKVGSDITFTANGSHPLVGIEEGNSNPIPASETKSDLKVTFTKAGTYKFICQFHVGLGMNGTVIVTN